MRTDFAPPMLPLKTFIVEDSPLIRENLIATLEELVSIEVVGTAEDEISAVQQLSQPGSQIDLVIIDIFLKGGSGLGVLRAAGHVRNVVALGHGAHANGMDGNTSDEVPGHPRKLVVLSNYATPDMRRKCLELGADRVFDKSNDIEALITYCCRLAAGGTGDTAAGALVPMA
jgi:DNA-binding NarL/FixJ family response regulator